MANAGLQIVNDGGSVQIDQGYRNLCLRQKGNAVTTGNLVSGTSWMSFNVSGLTSPIIAVGGAVGASAQTYWDAANSRHGFLISAIGAIGTSIPYYIFDVPAELGSTYGFQVRDTAGALIFDALQPPLRVRGFYVNASGGDSSKPSGRTYAVAHVKLGFRIYKVEIYSRLAGTRATATGFDRVNINYSDVSGGTQTVPIERLPDYMLIDVTNI